jgi:aminopeptidase N
MRRGLKIFLFFSFSIGISLLPLRGQKLPSGEDIYNAYREFRNFKADSGEVIIVKDLILKKDIVEIKLNGEFLKLKPLLGQEIGGIFSGNGVISFSPAPPLEKKQLIRFTGKERFEEEFNKAIIFFSDNTFTQIKEKSSVSEVRPSEKIISYWNDFVKMMHDKRKVNFEARFLAGLVNSEQGFTMYFDTEKYGKFIFSIDPMADEEISLVNYSPEDFYDIWCSFHFIQEYQHSYYSVYHNKNLGDVLKTEIYTEVDKDGLLSGKTLIEFSAKRDGVRMLNVDLAPSLRVSKVTNKDRELKFIQEDKKKDSQLWIILDEPLQFGKEYEISFNYKEEKGDDTIIEKTGDNNFFVSKRTSWFPNFYNFNNKCLYEMTFKVPAKYQVIATGRLINKYKDGDFSIWEFDTEIPFPRAGFSYGKFISKTKRDDQIAIECFSNPDLDDALRGIQILLEQSPELQQEVGFAPTALNTTKLLESVLNEVYFALKSFTIYYGDLPYSYIAVTQQSAGGFGQSWPTLIYLPFTSFLPASVRYQLHSMSNEIYDVGFYREVGPHEIAHQWWGNATTERTYHDEWISEGFSQFSAGLFLQLTKKLKDYLDFLENEKNEIIFKGRSGKRVNDEGPIWLGRRLYSHKSPEALNLIYSKGGYVLHMLRQMMKDKAGSDERFIAMMKEFFKTYTLKDVTTEGFKKIVEKHMIPEMDMDNNGKMDWFFNQWVYGTDIPEYEYSYKIEKIDKEKYLFRLKMVQKNEIKDFKMPVPIYLQFKGKILRLGRMFIKSGESAVVLKTELPAKPDKVLPNAFNDVLCIMKEVKWVD